MKKLIRADITLLSPTDRITVPAQICYEDGEDTVYSVEIQLTFNNALYQGNGTDNLWADAFADLQNKLPNGLTIA